MPRHALWCALHKYGIPEKLIELVHSFHQGMSATVIVCGEKSSSFPVTNGLRQGCTIALTLFTVNWERFTGLNFRVFYGFQEHRESFAVNIHFIIQALCNGIVLVL